MADHSIEPLKPDTNPSSSLTTEINNCFPPAFDSMYLPSRQDLDSEFTSDLPIPLSFDDDFDLDVIFDDVNVEDFLNSSGSDEFISSNDPECGASGGQEFESQGQWPGPFSASGSCHSAASGDNSNSDSGNFDTKEDIKVEENSSHDSSSKRKEKSHNEDYRAKKFMKSEKEKSNTSEESLTFQFGGPGEMDDKRKARLMRNRESAQLSRQRKKHYVEELEEKVRGMHSMISDLNGKISFFMAENATLRQQLSGNNVCPTPLYPPTMAPVPYPWMSYPAYMVKPQGSQVPLVPIPKLKPQPQKPVAKKKIESEKPKSKTKKLASVAVLSMLSICLFFGGFFPHNETIRDSSKLQKGHHGRILVANNVSVSPNNETQPLFASLYVPRNDKLEKIDGNLIIHSVLASEKAKAFNANSNKTNETRLSIRSDYSPLALPDGSQHTHFQSAGRLQWFREGLAEPMLSSGMCSEVFQFDVSSSSKGAIVRSMNMTSMMNNRRVLHGLPVNKLNLTGESRGKRELERNKSASTVVSVLVDPREVGEIEVDGILSQKSLSRIFVVVLLDSVKYVTYSCRLPHTTPHIVTT